LEITGIICEYNPFHLGHQKQLDTIKAEFGEESAIVCIMSGNFVQRGMPAIFDKLTRARAAVDCGADLVLELPVTAALSSAEGFAAEGVLLLAPFCQRLCFGA
jgi:predicted nucleotidyltransferase